MASFVGTALRTFENDFAPLLKGISLSTFAPLILVAFVAFFAFKLFFGDSAATSAYSPYARSLALTAANLWDQRQELGLSPNIRGRTLDSLEPLTEVLDALSNTVRKYELQAPAPNSFQHSSSKVRFE